MDSAELAEVRAQLREARQTIEAIRRGDADSVMAGPPQELQAVFDHAMTGIGEMTPTGEIVRVNSYFCQLTGYTQDELRSMRVQDIVFPDDRAADLAGMRRLQSGEIGSYSTVKRYLRKDGSVVWAEVNRALVRDETGRALIVATVHDMTAQRKAEAEAKAAAAYNRSLIEASLDPLVTIGANGKITDINIAAEQATGFGRAELIGTEFSRYFTDPDLARAGYEQAFRDGAVRDYPLELRRRDGQSMPVLYNASVYRDSSGRAIGVFAAARDVTQIRSAEAALRESQERLAAIFDNAPVGMTEIAPSGEVRRVNSRMCQLAGYTADELLSMRSGDVSEPEDHAADAARMQRLLAGEIDSYVAESGFRRKGGDTARAEVSRTLVRDDNGEPVMIVSAVRDITAQRQAEAEVRAAAAYDRSLIEASLDPLVTIGEDGTITDANTATEDAVGRSRDELIGTDFSGYFTEPDRARAGYEQVFRNGAVREYPLELRHRDGHTTPVLYNAAVYADQSGQGLGVFAAARDVTGIRHAEAELRESQERLALLFDYAPVGIDELGPDGSIVRVNPRFCEITGYTSAQLRSMHVQELIHPDDLEADRANVQRMLSGELDSYTMERRFLRRDGSIVWAEVNRAVVRDDSGEPLLVVGAVRDMTVQRKAEAEVSALNAELGLRVEQRTAELERANKNLEAFTYSVSHDLRSPLRALSGFSEALVEEYGDRLDETGRGYASRIEAASARMAALIDDLLLLSRVSRVDMNVRPVDLSAEVADVVEEMRLREPGRQVRVIAEDGVWVRADRTFMRSVVQNLIENAWKFTADRDDATIEFGTMARDDAGICCFVRDNGAGFDPAYIAKLFQPFQRLHSAAEFPGTGVGLASVQRIIERHGGRVWAEGAVDQGATFYFTVEGASRPAEPASDHS
jgi:PAS domain S-box-containing protein